MMNCKSIFVVECIYYWSSSLFVVERSRSKHDRNTSIRFLYSDSSLSTKSERSNNIHGFLYFLTDLKYSEFVVVDSHDETGVSLSLL